jgi:hypothetical protein
MLLFAALAGLAILSGGAARAESSARVAISMGGWRSGFSQSDSDREAAVSTIPSLGLGFDLGFQVSLFFVEYTTHWFLPAYTPPDRAQDAHDLSLWGVNAGVSLRPIPIEAYIGLEGSGFGLSGGVGPEYAGMAWKAGANVYLFAPASRWVRMGLKAEYRRATFGEDQAGPLPNGVSTGADIYFFGVTIGSG